MKRLFRLLLILGLAAGTWSCADDGTPSVSINGGTDFLSLDHLARSGKITVNAPAPWSVTLAPENYGQDEKPDWLTLSAEEGPAGYSEIDVTFAENPGPARSASLLFSCDGKTLAFTVSQSAGGTGFDAPGLLFLHFGRNHADPLFGPAPAFARQTELRLLRTRKHLRRRRISRPGLRVPRRRPHGP